MKSLLRAFIIFFPSLVLAMEGIKVGSNVPDLILQDTQGKKIELKKLRVPTALVFYRGSWCPFCMNQLKSIQAEVLPHMPKNSSLILISVDRLKIAKKMKDKFNFKFQVVSDPKAKTLTAFNIINKLDTGLVQKYKNSYQIDIEGDSGETHHMVAHPAVFVIKNGKITFSDVHTNYKERTPNSRILQALK